MVKTTMKINRKTLERLDRFKVHPRQPYDEVIGFLLIHCEEAKKKGDLEVFKK